MGVWEKDFQGIRHVGEHTGGVSTDCRLMAAVAAEHSAHRWIKKPGEFGDTFKGHSDGVDVVVCPVDCGEFNSTIRCLGPQWVDFLQPSHKKFYWLFH